MITMRRRLMWELRHGRESPVTIRIHFGHRGTIGPVQQAAIGRAAVPRVEGDRRQPAAIVDLPSVRPSVTIVVVLRMGEDSVLVVLGPCDAPVAFGRDVDAGDRSVRSGERPGVLLPVVGTGESDLFETSFGSVVFPALDTPILVL